MIAQRDSWTMIAGATLAGLLVTLMAAPALAQDANYDARWLPWLGCWEASMAPPDADAPMLCLRADADVDGIEMLTVVDGEIVSRETILADGVNRQVSREGCDGRESTTLSDTGYRVYLSSDFICEGGVGRSSTGLMSMASPTEWLDVRSVEVAGETVPWVLWYQLASPEAVDAAGIDGIGADRIMAQQSARMAASAPLTIDDVVEVSSRIEATAVEAWLVESGGAFDLDADVLVSMADADVPSSVIDMVVAVSYPDRFVVDQGLEGDPELEVADYSQRRGYGRGAWSGGSIYGPGYGRYSDRYIYDPYFLSPFYSPYAGYGYYSPYGHGIGFGGGISGWGFGYNGYRPYRNTVVFVSGGDRNEDTGRAVRGRGYSRGGTQPASDGARQRPSSSGGASAAPSRSGSSGSKSSGRKAKRRPSG